MLSSRTRLNILVYSQPRKRKTQTLSIFLAQRSRGPERFSLFCRLYRLLVAVGLFAVACNPRQNTPLPTPTSPPTLNTSLWVDFPVVSANHSQAANVVINDTSGQPVAGVNVKGIYHTPDGNQVIDFPITDASGQTRVPLPLPAVNTPQTITLTVYVSGGGEWGRSVTSFEFQP